MNPPKLVLIDDIADVVNNHFPGIDWYMEDAGQAWEMGIGYFAYDPHNDVYRPNVSGVMVPLKDFDFTFCWRGNGPEPGNRNRVPTKFVTLFNRVQRAKTTASLVIDIPKDRAQELRDWVRSIGGRVQG